MIPHPTVELVVTALVAGILCTALLRSFMTWRMAACIAIIRVAIPFVYFAWFYSGEWTIIDDVYYTRTGRMLLDAGYDPFTIFFSREGFGTLLVLSDGYHFLYGWFNLLAEFVVGPTYFAAVFFNVVLTCASAVMLHGLARDAGAPPRYARALASFFALQWELVAWASFLNVKDLLVLTLTVGLLRALVATMRGVTVRRVSGILLSAFLLLWIRFYVPFIAAAAMIAYLFISARLGVSIGRVVLWLVVLGAVVFLVRNRIQFALSIIHPSVGDVVFGWVRTLLSPQPWSVNRDYGFLEIPSLLHFLTFPLLVYGAVLLARDGGPARLLLLYSAFLLVPIAAYPDVQGPRHRIQLLFVVAWCQFHGAYAWAARLQRGTRRASARLA